MVCKARLAARGFEECGRNMEMEAPTCAPETLKICIAKISKGLVKEFGGTYWEFGGNKEQIRPNNI